jgi:hypothetical protein
MTHRLTIFCIAAGTLAMASSESMAQIGPGIDVDSYSVGLGPYGSYDGGSHYGYAYYGGGYYGSTHAIYGGPSSDLFSYEGPNRGAMERSDR